MDVVKSIVENLKDVFSFFAKKQVFILVVGLVCCFFVPQILPDNYEGSKQYFITVGISLLSIYVGIFAQNIVDWIKTCWLNFQNHKKQKEKTKMQQDFEEHYIKLFKECDSTEKEVLKYVFNNNVKYIVPWYYHEGVFVTKSSAAGIEYRFKAITSQEKIMKFCRNWEIKGFCYETDNGNFAFYKDVVAVLNSNYQIICSDK